MASFLKTMVMNCYDLQKLRIQLGNRVFQQCRQALGLQSSDREEELDKEKQKLLSSIRKEYRLIADGINECRRNAQKESFFENHNGIIHDFTTFQMITSYEDVLAAELVAFANLKPFVHREPLWHKFLVNIQGLGEAMAGIIIAYINFEEATYVSKIWKYLGIDTVPEDGRGRSRIKAHLVTREYINKEGEKDEKLGLSFNPLLKTKMLGVLSGSFLIHNQYYHRVYSDYKYRLNHDPHRAGTILMRDGEVFREFSNGMPSERVQEEWLIDRAQKSKGGFLEFPPLRIHRMAIRYMIKIFCIDLYMAGRQIYGLPLYDPYQESKLGLRRHTNIVEIDGVYTPVDAITGEIIPQAKPRLKTASNPTEEERPKTARERKQAHGRKFSDAVTEKVQKKRT